jgi:hypothetical protein
VKRIAVLSVASLVLFLLGTGTAHAWLIYDLTSPGVEWNGRFGWSVSWAGDVNNDGCFDFIVGAPHEDPSSSPDSAGRAYIFSGQTGATLHTLISPDEQSYGQFGYAVSFAGDVNNDSHFDVIVGAPDEDPALPPWPLSDAGRAYVFDGATGDTVRMLLSPNPQAYGYFGYAVAGVGDIDGDGYFDVVVGAPWESPGGTAQAGRAYVFSGQTGAVLHTLVSPNAEVDGYFGFSVAGIGDANNDGTFDIAVGTPYEDPGASPDSAGRAYIFSGATGTALHTLVSPNEESQGYFGNSLWGNIDANNDGFNDVVVGAPREDLPWAGLADAGQAYIFSGQTGGMMWTLTSPNAQDDGWFGYSVCWAGDVDSAGCSDVIVGAPYEDLGPGNEGAGRAYIFSGEAGAPLYVFVSPNPAYAGAFGSSVSGLTDIDSDAIEDFVIGAYHEIGAFPGDRNGRAYVMSPWDFSLAVRLTPAGLWMQWHHVPGAWEYLTYGEPNNPYFPPTPENLQYEASQGTYTWTTTLGLGDSDMNWTFIVRAMDDMGEEMVRTNYAGEFDFGMLTPR